MVVADPASGGSDQAQSPTLSTDGKRLAWGYSGSSAGVGVKERTGDGPTFGSATLLSPTGTTVSEPVISGSGNAVVWQSSGIKGNKDRSSGGWLAQGSPASFSGGGNGQAVASDGSRVFWKSSGLKTAVWNADGTPGTETLIDNSGNFEVFAEDGQSMAFQKSVSSVDRVFVATAPTWTPVQVTSGSDVDADHLIGMSADGTKLLYRNENNDTVMGMIKTGGTWGAPRQITTQEVDYNNSYIWVGGDGSLAFQSRTSGANNNGGYVVLFRDGDWQPEVKLADNVTIPRISDDGKTFAYLNNDNNRNVVVRMLEGQTWSNEIKITDESTPLNYAAQLYLAGNGKALAYRGGDFVDSNIYYSELVEPDNTTVAGKPAKPRDLKVSGGPRAKKYVASWKKPSDPTGTRPTEYFRLKLNQRGVKNLIIDKKLNAAVLKYSFTRKFLLKNSKRTRGDVNSALGYRVRVEAFNSAGGGPISAKTFVLKL